MRVDNVPDPKIQHPRDAIIRITSTAICGSDLHLYNGMMAGMKSGDIIGHEPMGIVEEVGSSVTHLKKGDRVVVPFTISCGSCYFCDKDLFSLCDESNPNRSDAEKALGHSPAGLFGYSHLTGGFPGGQAEYLRVPFADVGPIKIPEMLADEQVLFLSDILPTGWMAAANCDIQPTDTVAVWGCGPVGQFAIQSAWLMGAKRVIAIDDFEGRLQMARDIGKAETINFSKEKVYDRLMEMTGGMGPDKCIEAVGGEAHTANALVDGKDTTLQAMHVGVNRAYALNEAVMNCRKGGVVSVPGVYTGNIKDFAAGAFMNKGLTMKTGQTHVQHYLPKLLKLIEDKKIDPSLIITHTVNLSEAPAAYKHFNEEKDKYIKVVLKP